MKKKYSRLAIWVLMVAVFYSGCKQKDPAELDMKEWVDRNDSCAVQAIKDIHERLRKKIADAEELTKQLQAELLKGNCPLAKNPECIPEVGVQAMATYISYAANRIIKKTSNDSIVDNADNESIADALAGLKKKGGGRELKTSGKIPEKKESPKVEVRTEAIQNELSPEVLEKKSMCAMKVSEKCSFETLDKIVAKLIVFADQVRNFEKEIKSILSTTSSHISQDSVLGMYKILKTIESNVSDLVLREEASRKNPKMYGQRYNAINPLKIKGIMVNMTGAIPSTITSILKKYSPALKKSKEMYIANRDGFKSRLRAQSKNFFRDKRMHANNCLEKKGCWNFRTCIKRFSLPGILMFK
ncbi:MAG: hypothetical protein JXR95_08850 [Deltaproteobacteria bacterium]|nr:hypothetical protein [Deltaproteobacteria bacterium]